MAAFRAKTDNSVRFSLQKEAVKITSKVILGLTNLQNNDKREGSFTHLLIDLKLKWLGIGPKQTKETLFLNFKIQRRLLTIKRNVDLSDVYCSIHVVLRLSK